ncbi:MAG: hypothetical protein MZV64_44000 [Ignavibacteriales bacterium]|nr:hypothetical protein [Ignavibacteriales bacterium]
MAGAGRAAPADARRSHAQLPRLRLLDRQPGRCPSDEGAGAGRLTTSIDTRDLGIDGCAFYGIADDFCRRVPAT